MNRRVPSPWLRPQTGPIVPLRPTRGAGFADFAAAPVAELAARRPRAPSTSSVRTLALRDMKSLPSRGAERLPPPPPQAATATSAGQQLQQPTLLKTSAAVRRCHVTHARHVISTPKKSPNAKVRRGCEELRNFEEK